LRSAQSAECGVSTLLCDRHLAFAAVGRAVTIEMRCRSRGWASARSRGIRSGLVQAVFRDRAPTTLAPGPSTRCCSKGATLYRQQAGVGSNLVAPPPQVPTAREGWDPVSTAAPVGLLTTCLSWSGHGAEAQVSCGFLPRPWGGAGGTRTGFLSEMSETLRTLRVGRFLQQGLTS
jgi:hypothetical protein